MPAVLGKQNTNTVFSTEGEGWLSPQFTISTFFINRTIKNIWLKIYCTWIMNVEKHLYIDQYSQYQGNIGRKAVTNISRLVSDVCFSVRYWKYLFWERKKRWQITAYSSSHKQYIYQKTLCSVEVDFCLLVSYLTHKHARAL